jgi:hypothetical protein
MIGMMKTVALWSALCCLALPAPAMAADSSADDEFFEKQIRPILVEHCYECHSASAKKLKGGLRLDSRSGVLKGGDSGPVVVPGQPGQSRLIEAIRYQSVDVRMPPRRKLPERTIADLTSWVRRGAPWPAQDASREAAVVRSDFDLQKRKREHWAWQPIRATTPPAVKDQAWPHGAVDRFILAKLDEHGLTPAAPADRRALIRRVTFDLIGLPPTPAEVEAFVGDTSSGAFERVVDRLLASPHFGERWARHWLDLVRYAETRGHEFDYVTPNAYQYRDYVIRALNEDVPYNQFVLEHLAGDLLEQPRLNPVERFNESILGTGFWFLGEETHSPVDVQQDEADRFDNRIDVLSKTFLGLTVACARCHDHKFDAISTRDYYALFGFLVSSSYRLARFDTMLHNRAVAAELDKLRERDRATVQRALAEALRPGVSRLADYLLASRALLQTGTVSLDEAARARVEGAARIHKLDSSLLGRWIQYLPTAAQDEHDPLHAWAKIALDPEAKDPERLGERLRSLVQDWRKHQIDVAAARMSGVVVLDYGQANPADWILDGVAFGQGPVRPGQVHFGSEPLRPIAQVFDYTGAAKDPTWDCLKEAPGSEKDPGGALGGPVRAGRSIRTPTFSLTAGKLFYLVKGHGQAYAAVHQHALINGPLHARLVQPIMAGDHFQWVEHDLSAYKGLRAHVEFTATDGSDFAVALVMKAPKMPPAVDPPNHLLLRALDGADAAPETLAQTYQRLLLDTLDRLAGDHIASSPDAADYAQLANWLVHHPELFLSESSAAAKRLAEATGPLLAKRARIVARIRPQSRVALAMQDGNGLDGRVFIRGSPRAPGEVVPRRFLEALAGPERLQAARGSGRLELARQMIDPALNPFIARVVVNRVWHHLFGRGIVASVDNFGVLGEPPTHPELLDYLAEQFVRDGWSGKRLIREMVLSSTYRLSSQPDAALDQADPQDLLLHRMRLRRLEGEAIRDAMLSVSGRMNERLYGAPVPVYLTEFQDGRGRPASGPLDGAGRRSIYLAVRRNFLSPFLLAFDTPIPFSTVGRRTVSNVPAQSLILMNDPFVHQQAEAWARRVIAQKGDTKELIISMYQRAFARQPDEAELRACIEFLDRQTQLGPDKTDNETAWTDLAHALFNAKEFIYLP